MWNVRCMSSAVCQVQRGLYFFRYVNNCFTSTVAARLPLRSPEHHQEVRRRCCFLPWLANLPDDVRDPLCRSLQYALLAPGETVRLPSTATAHVSDVSSVARRRCVACPLASFLRLLAEMCLILSGTPFLNDVKGRGTKVS